MKDTLHDYSLAEQIRIDQDAADQEMIQEAIVHRWHARFDLETDEEIV